MFAAFVFVAMMSGGLVFYFQDARNSRIAAELSAARKDMEILLKLSKEVEIANDYYAIQLAVNAALKERTGISNTWIYLARPDQPDVVELLSFVGSEEGVVRTTTAVLETKGDAMMEEIMTSRHAVVVENARTDPRTNKVFVEKEKIWTLINIPMRMADRLVGCLGAGTFGEEGIHRFPRAEIEFFEAVGARTAVALDRLRQFFLRGKEEELRISLARAIDFASDGILVAGPDQNVIYVNPAFERIAGGMRDRLQGEKWHIDAGLVGDRVQMEKIMDAVESRKDWFGRLKVEVRGSEKVLEISITQIAPSISPQGGYVAVFRDVTSDENLNRAKDFFVKVTSHELRTPLSKLYLTQDILNRFFVQNAAQLEEMQNCGRALEDAYQSLNHILETTSLFTELSSGPPDLDLKASIHPILMKCLDSSRTGLKAEGRNVTLQDEIGVDRGLLVNILSSHLSQALGEVLSNAVKYTPDGMTVILRAFRRELTVVIEVVNHGASLSDAELRTLFTPFYSIERIEKHSSGRYKYQGGGLGLGLSLVKLVIERYGGTVTIERLQDAVGMKTVIVLPLSA